MKNNYKLKIICLLCLVIAAFSSCKKSEQGLESQLANKHNKLASAGDGKWDVLGYGFDATGDYLNNNNLSDVAIIDFDRFEIDYKKRIDVGSGSNGRDSVYFGSSALDYLKELNKKRAYGFQASYGNEKPADNGNKKFFSASVNTNNEDHTISTYYSKYSYATYESIREVKRIRFTGDVSLDLLKNYLTPEFINNVATKDADYLVNRYGTHILLDITLGGRLRFDYTAYTSNQSDYSQRKRDVKVGISGSLKKLGINFTSDVSNEEITKNFNESQGTQFTVVYFGGTNSGLSMTADKDRNFSQSFSLASWQQSVTDRNCQLIDVGKAVLLSEFITDPIKKQQVNNAIQARIDNSQRNELGEVPIYQYKHNANQDYLYSLSNNAIDPSWPGWEYQGPAFYGFNSAKNGSVPIYEYRHHQQTRTIYSSNPNYIQSNWPGWSSPSVAFYAYTQNNIPGTVPIFEFYNQQTQCNFYSHDANAVNGYSGWVRTGIVFYAFR